MMRVCRKREESIRITKVIDQVLFIKCIWFQESVVVGGTHQDNDWDYGPRKEDEQFIRLIYP